MATAEEDTSQGRPSGVAPKTTLLVTDVLPAIGGCDGDDLAALNEACDLDGVGDVCDAPAMALLNEIDVGVRLLRPISAPIAAWITSRDELAGQDLGRLLPDLVRASGPIAPEQLSVEANQVLIERDASVWSSLVRRSPNEMADWPGMTRTRVEEVVAVSLREAAVQSLRLTLRPSSERGAGVAADLMTVAAWVRGELGLETLGEAFALMPTATDLPEEVAVAWDRLTRTPLSQLAGAATDRYDVGRAMDRLLTLEPAMATIVRERIYPAGKKRTLDDLGQSLGVTRERVRQIEKRAKDLLGERLGHPAFGPVTRAAARLGRDLGCCTAIDRLPAEVARALSGDAPPTDENDDLRMRVLLDLAGPYELFDRWLVRAPASELVGVTRDQIEAAMGSGTLAREDVAGILADHGIPETERGLWLEVVCQCRAVEDRIILWQGSMADKTERLLALAGEPMTVDEIVEMMGPETNVRSLLMQVQGDRRFLRRGKKHYGLTEWGGEEYTTIQEEIAQEIERQGGSASLEHLITTLCNEFGVSESSVRAYAADVPFVRLPNDEIAIGTADTRRFEPRSMAQTKDCFRLDGQWALRFVVDKDLLRGSGRTVPVAVMQHLGIAPGGQATLTFPECEVALRWGRQATVGSLRSVAREQGCAKGDLLFVRFIGNMRAESQRVRRSEVDAASGLGRLALEVGVGGTGGDLVEDIAVTLGLDEDDRRVAGIRRRLRGRREDDLVGLVPDEASEGIGHDDVLKQIMDLR